MVIRVLLCTSFVDTRHKTRDNKSSLAFRPSLLKKDLEKENGTVHHKINRVLIIGFCFLFLVS